LLTESPFARLVVSHLLSVVGFLMAAVLLARASHQRRPTGSTLAWLLAIVLIPYVGVPFFVIFGGRKVKRTLKRHAPSAGTPSAAPTAANERDDEDDAASRLGRMLCASGGMSATTGNRIELLGDGEAAFAAVMAAIASAKSSVSISTLVFAGDEVGEAVTAALEERARAGVQVRVLIDGLFKFRSRRRQIARLREAGAKVAWFMRLWTFPTRGSMNLRLHRKEVLIDDRLAIVGGTNLAREYMGPTPLASRWRDLSMTVTGPAVADIGALFRADWEFASGEAMDPAPSLAADGGARVQVVGSGPDSENDLIYDAFLSAIFEAKRRISIATPYFVPDEAIVHALVLAIRRGVAVQILVPLRSNHRTADLAGAAYLRELRDAGGSIRCYEPGMMHAKILLVDDDVGILGSANMDRRSFFLDYEIALLIADREEVARMAAWLVPLLERSVDLPPAGRIRALVEPFARLLAPLE
jgi:cardiolipin synthase